jgi:hypothetical protein
LRSDRIDLAVALEMAVGVLTDRLRNFIRLRERFAPARAAGIVAARRSGTPAVRVV